MNFNYELINRLKIEYEKKDRSGIYAITQRMLAYNSNKIEGSTLTEEQTASLFVFGAFEGNSDLIKAQDVEEMTGHFIMFNSMLNTYKEPLSAALIKKYHYDLKAGVFFDKLNGYPIGEFKNRANIVSDTVTTKPENVEKEITALFENYNKIENVTVKDLAELHYKYEKIHPFQDGNGRTGRIILFKECLKNDIIPFIIEDFNKIEYYSSLKKAEEGDYSKLIYLFEKSQARYYDMAKDFVISYENDYGIDM